MAPALTSEATTRSRDKLPTSPLSPACQETKVVAADTSHNTPLLHCPPHSRIHNSGLLGLTKEVLQQRLLDPDINASHAKIIYKELASIGIHLTLPSLVSSQALGVSTNSCVSSGSPGLIMSTGNGRVSENSVDSDQLVASCSNSASDNLKSQSMGISSTAQATCTSSASQSTASNGVNSLSHPTPIEVTSIVHDLVLPGPSRIPRVTQEDATAAVVAKQKVLQTKAERLLRRLRRLQTRQAVSHTRQQMIGLVDYQRNTLNLRSVKSENEEKSSLLQDKDVKNLSTSALVNLIQSWQSQHAQAVKRQEARDAKEAEPKVKLGDDFCVELDRVGGNLQTNLQHLQCSVDSDATESSSGGESCDDMDYDDWDGKAPRPPIERRADWKWSQERTEIASRWTWLQAQVSDLEYRIRQQNDIYRQIRQSKGSVVLADLPQTEPTVNVAAVVNQRPVPLEQNMQHLQTKTEASPCNISTMLNNVDKQSSHLTRQLGNVYSPLTTGTVKEAAVGKGVPNGLVDSSGPSQGNTAGVQGDPAAAGMFPAGHFAPASPANDATCVAARCRPVKTYRIRKLLRTCGLHQVSRKASKLATVKCCCYPPKPPCAMCGGRYNNFQRLQMHMSVQEKVALLDPAYHPVLSFISDAPLALHFESLLKSGEWQQQKAPSKAFAKMMNMDKKKKINVKERPKKYNNKRMSKSASAAMLNRIKNKYEQKQLSKSANGPTTPTKHGDGVNGDDRRRLNITQKVRKRKGGLGGSDSSQKRPRLSLGNRVSRASMSGLDGGKEKGESSTFKEMKDALRKRRGENAFDIDNIVIPYSIAAATRVEKPKYKEIATPKWREVLENMNKNKCSNSEMHKSETEKQEVDFVKPQVESTAVVPGVSEVVPKENDAPVDQTEDDQDEDISEEAYLSRHYRCEINEKRKFMSYMIAQRRGRGHRTDSVNDGGGGGGTGEHSPKAQLDTSQPSATLHTSLSSGSLASPSLLAPPPLSALGDDDEAVLASYELARQRRSSSVSSSRSRAVSQCDDKPDDLLPTVCPWIPRRFPLSDEDNERLSQEKAVYPAAAAAASRLELREKVLPSTSAGPRAASPVGSNGSDTSSVGGDDPNDPEWTVDESEQQQQQQTKLVLRLTKR